MLVTIKSEGDRIRDPRRERRLWCDASVRTMSIGCVDCPDRRSCGGLQVEANLYNCLDLCCGNIDGCDVVCRNKPHDFAQRVREIDGFGLENVPRSASVAVPDLPNVIPWLSHGGSRGARFSEANAVSIPLYKVIHRRDGEARYANADELAQTFGLSRSTRFVFTGTAFDPPLERWWSLGPGRLDAIRGLKALNPALVTVPNFSLFVDQPRWDDMHNMKRIAVVHEEFLREGVAAALHLNARTDKDYERWRDYLHSRPEVTHVAFEFATGASSVERMRWHADQLVALAVAAGRPLHLVLRGGTGVLSRLVSAYQKVTIIDTSTFLRTMKRRRAMLTPSGALSWVQTSTGPERLLDSLFLRNWRVVSQFYLRHFENRPALSKAAG